MSKKVKILTGGKTLTVELFDATPKTSDNFLDLAKKGFYKDLKFHRVLPGFVVQGGCPNGNGAGGPGYTIQCECTTTTVDQFHDKGILSMAHAGRDTGGSQFFIVLGRSSTAHLDGNHTCFGRVTEGIEYLDNIKQGDGFDVVVD